MENFVINNKNVSFTLTDEKIIVKGTYQENGEGQIIAINGYCYRNNEGAQGAQFGEFHGAPDAEGNMTYDLSSMSRKDSNLTWAAIDDIEAAILPQEETEEE